MFKNKKGFTLIELLAVIVILGVIMAIAVPAVSTYITKSRKDAFVDNAKQYVKDVNTKANAGLIDLPVNKDEATVVIINSNTITLDSGKLQSGYGYEYDSMQASATTPKSYIVIVQEGADQSNPKYAYYVALEDVKGNQIALERSDDIKYTDVGKGKTITAFDKAVDTGSDTHVFALAGGTTLTVAVTNIVE